MLAAGLIRDDLEAHWLSLAWASSHPPQRPPRSPSGRAPTARRWRGRARLLSQAKGEPPGSRARPSSPRCCICIVTSAVARRTRRTNSGSSAPPATRARRAAGAGLVEWTRTKRLDEGCETPVCLVQLGSPCPGDAARHTSSGHSPYRKRSLARGSGLAIAAWLAARLAWASAHATSVANPITSSAPARVRKRSCERRESGGSHWASSARGLSPRSVSARAGVRRG